MRSQLQRIRTEHDQSARPQSRRNLLKRAASGFGYVALAGLAHRAAAQSANPLATRSPHFKPRAKRVIFLCMQGGPSHIDTFDYKPKLKQDNVDDHDPNVEALISSFELGFRMQQTVPQVMDLKDETRHTLEMYGIGQDETDQFGRQCLYARRLSEQGVRFIELTHNNWDQHGNLVADHARHCRATDQPIAALLADLKQRGLLEDTLVLWGGEFGRTPDAQLNTDGSVKDGRDHNPDGFTFWMAGGGVKEGFCYGQTDEHGYEAVEGKIGIHDLHATILHLMGLDHKRLTFRYSGRDFRLTDVHGNVIDDILA